MEKEDLEAMRDMDEQISEEQKEVEKDLRKEIEALHISINEVNRYPRLQVKRLGIAVYFMDFFLYWNKSGEKNALKILSWTRG